MRPESHAARTCRRRRPAARDQGRPPDGRLASAPASAFLTPLGPGAAVGTEWRSSRRCASGASTSGVVARASPLLAPAVVALALASAAAVSEIPSPKSYTKRSPLLQRKDEGGQPLAVAEFQPLEICDAFIYCKPSAGSRWHAGDQQVVVQWNKAQTNLLTTGTVDLALYERRKLNLSSLGDHKLIYQETRVNVQRGFRFINVDNATVFSKWGAAADLPGNDPNNRLHFWVITATNAPQTTKQEPGPDFYISSYPRNVSATPATATTLSTVLATTTETSAGPAAAGILPRRGEIVALCLGGFALLLAALAAVLLCRRRKRGLATARTPLESSPDLRRAESSTTVVGAPGRRDGGAAAADGREAGGAESEEDAARKGDAAGPISSSDARMLAVAFRQLLRKPSWSVGAADGGPGNGEDLEERQEAEEEFRRRTRELVEQELSEEGKGLKSVSVHNLSESSSVGDARGDVSDEEGGDGGQLAVGAKNEVGGRPLAPDGPLLVEAQTATMSGTTPPGSGESLPA